LTTWTGTLPTFLAGEEMPATKPDIHGDVLAALTDPWSSYTPALTGSTTDPTLGTGGSITGAYIQTGKLVIGRFQITFGTSGVNGGSGTYSVSLPVASVVTASSADVGTALLRDAAPMSNVAILLPGTSTTVAMWPHGVGGAVSNTVPWTWAANDRIIGRFEYEAA